MIHIDEHTKVVARMHPQPNNRGLQIYNPYFAAHDINAVYLLFHDPDIRKLLTGMRSLGLAGAIPAGFEHDPDLPGLVDELSPTAKRIGRVGNIVNDNGKLIGHYNGGLGYAEAIKTVTPIKGKRVVVMGAGSVVRGLLAHLELAGEYPASVAVYNRTLEHAQAVAREFSVDHVGNLGEMFAKAEGDIFIHATNVGTPWNKGDDVVFPPEFLRRFDTVADTTFVPLKPPLIVAAEAAGVKVVPGWMMFVQQGAYTMGSIVGANIDADELGKFAVADFEKNWS